MARLVQTVAGGLAVVALLVGSQKAWAFNLLTNGNFESGSLTGWNVGVQPDSFGSFFISTPGAATPGGNPGVQFPTENNVLPGGGGSFYAVSTPVTGDDAGPGAHALYQSFTVPVGTLTSLTLSFQMFVNDYGNFGFAVSPNAPADDLFFLDPFEANQFGRVDLLDDGVPIFSSAAADVVRNVYFNVDANQGNPALWAQYIFDIAANVVPGQTYTLRFADVSTVSPIAMGVDNVAVDYVGAGRIVGTPEPASVALVLTACLGVCGRRVVRKRKY